MSGFLPSPQQPCTPIPSSIFWPVQSGPGLGCFSHRQPFQCNGSGERESQNNSYPRQLISISLGEGSAGSTSRCRMTIQATTFQSCFRQSFTISITRGEFSHLVSFRDRPLKIAPWWDLFNWKKICLRFDLKFPTLIKYRVGLPISRKVLQIMFWEVLTADWLICSYLRGRIKCSTDLGLICKHNYFYTD